MNEEIPFREKAIATYREYVITHEEAPKSIGTFARDAELNESELFAQFGSLCAIRKALFEKVATDVAERLHGDEVYSTYTAREQLLAFYFTLFERLGEERSFLLAWVGCSTSPCHLKRVGEFYGALKPQLTTLLAAILRKGSESGEIASRPFISSLSKHFLWTQCTLLITYWRFDMSAASERTDIAIEKSCHLVMDALGRGALDSAVELLAFLVKPSGSKTAA